MTKATNDFRRCLAEVRELHARQNRQIEHIQRERDTLLSARVNADVDDPNNIHQIPGVEIPTTKKVSLIIENIHNELMTYIDNIYWFSVCQLQSRSDGWMLFVPTNTILFNILPAQRLERSSSRVYTWSKRRNATNHAACRRTSIKWRKWRKKPNISHDVNFKNKENKAHFTIFILILRSNAIVEFSLRKFLINYH